MSISVDDIETGKNAVAKSLYISYVKGLKKHISLLLLAMFTLAILPAPALHEWFADHKDAAENHCHFYHKELGRHIEEKQDHCDLFKTLTPLYDAAKVQPHLRLFAFVGEAHIERIICSGSLSLALRLPARAPPIA